jgi:DNA-binding CsgD family transcriptional regulator
VVVANALVGRLAELDALNALIERSARSGQAVLVEGEAGIGKSRLLHAAAERAEELGFRVYSAAADELETRRPFGVVADALRVRLDASDPGWLEGSGGWMPSEAAAEFRMVEELVALVDHLSVDGPVALALDDVQWADASSLLVLNRLLRDLPRLPLLLVVASRPLPRRPELDSLLASAPRGALTRLHLGPVHQHHWPSLVESLLQAKPGPTILRLAEGANGNPLFIGELVGGLVSAGAIDFGANGQAETSATTLPPSVTAAIVQRLSFLSSQTLELLGLASILGTSFSAADLSLLAGRPVAAQVPRIREALRAGVIQEQGDRLAFRHQLICEVLYQDLPVSVRKGLHAELWRKLATSGAPAVRVAEHITRATSAGDAEAVSWLQRAAREVGPLAPSAAVDLLQQALDLLDPSDASRGSILRDLAVSLIWAGRLREGEATCRQALAQVSGIDGESWMRLCLAQALVLLDRAGDARREAELAAAATGATPAERVRASAWASLARMNEGDLTGAVDRAERACHEAERLGDAPARCQALATLSLAADVRARFGEAVELARDAAAEADRDQTREAHRALAHLILGRALADVDRLDEAGESIRRGRQISEALGARGAIPSHHFTASLRWFVAGNWDDAMAELETGLELAEEMDVGWRTPAYATAALIAIHRDDLPGAERWLGRLDADPLAPGMRYQLDRVQLARTLLLEAGGRLLEGLDCLSAAWDGCERAGVLAELPVLGPDLARLAVRCGESAAARSHAERIAQSLTAVAERNAQVPWVVGAALRCRGLADDDVDLLLESVRVYRSGPRPLERAEACEDAGAALLRRGEIQEARALFDEAYTAYQRLHANRDLRRVRAFLRAAGVRHGPHSPRRPKHGWQALTETELTVAGLVAERLSNPEIARRLFLSRRTVQTHVSHALAKLGMSSRLELGAEARRHSGSSDLRA